MPNQSPYVVSTRVRTFSRGKGDSIAAAAAYRAGTVIRDPRTGETFDFRRKSGVVETTLIGWNVRQGESVEQAAERLWQAAIAAERRRDAVEARELRFDLPGGPGTDPRMRAAIVHEVGTELRRRLGVAAQMSIHGPNSEANARNYHCHALITSRAVDEEGRFSRCKVALLGDRFGAGPQFIREMRAFIAERTGGHIRAAGIERWVEHRTYAEIYEEINNARRSLGLGSLEVPEPMRHEGPKVTVARREAARRGRALVSDVARKNEQIRVASAGAHERNALRLGRDVEDLQRHASALSITEIHAHSDVSISGVSEREAANDLAEELQQLALELTRSLTRPGRGR